MSEQITENKSNIEQLKQLVNAVKEGFQSQRDILANTIKGANRAQQNKVQQVNVQVTKHKYNHPRSIIRKTMYKISLN